MPPKKKTATKSVEMPRRATRATRATSSSTEEEEEKQEPEMPALDSHDGVTAHGTPIRQAQKKRLEAAAREQAQLEASRKRLQEEAEEKEAKEPPKKKGKKTVAKGKKNPKNTKPKKQSAVQVKKEKDDPQTFEKASRAPWFTRLEHENLCRAYVNCSSNPVGGSKQKGHVFWGQIAVKFRELMEQTECGYKTIRQWSSLEDKFKKGLSPAIARFNKYYKRIVDNHPSGTPESEWLELANLEFKTETGSDFKHLTCVPILHQMPKFDPTFKGSIDVEDDPDLAEGAEEKKQNKLGSVQGQNHAKPPGQKAAKS